LRLSIDIVKRAIAIEKSLKNVCLFMSVKLGKSITKKSKPNYFYSIISVALVLFLLGFFGVVALQAHHLIRFLKEQVNILVEIKPDAPKEDIAVIRDLIVKSNYAKGGSIKVISKEAAMKELQEDLGEDFLTFDFQNPLYDMIRFNTKAEFLESSSLGQIKDNLISHTSVKDVYYQEGLVDSIANNLKKIAWLALISGILLLFIAIALIHNTIKLALYANRFIIKNMELVGASWGFISGPYIKKSFFNGLWSAIIAIFMLIILLWVAQYDLPGFNDLNDYSSFAILFGALVIIGIIISTFSTYYVVNKYLKMRLDDLY